MLFIYLFIYIYIYIYIFDDNYLCFKFEKDNVNNFESHLTEVEYNPIPTLTKCDGKFFSSKKI